MSIAVVTGSSELIGSETSKYIHEKGLEIVGIDNDMRRYFFGEDASTAWNTRQLEKSLIGFKHLPVDIRDQEQVFEIFAKLGNNISLVLLEATRQYCPDAVFIFTSTNKVYGDTPNCLPLVERETRWEVAESHHYYEHGIDEGMSIDQSKHSIFGASKVAADLLVQEYGHYFELKTGTFRGGCLTGPAHSGAELHGFLAYLIKCIVTGKPYTIYR